MRHLTLLFTLLAITLLATAVFGQESKAKDESDAPRISVRDAKEAFDKKTAFFIDARGIEAYKIEHVKGALSLPLSDAPDLKDVPKDKKIIVYCS